MGIEALEWGWGVKDCAAVLLAAGSSQRLGFDKILTPLCGLPAFRYAFDVLASCPEIAEIVMVTREDLVKPFGQQLSGVETSVPVRVVAGGEERQDSVYAGLKAVDASCEMALIHDAARPLITGELVSRVLIRARETGAAICGRPCSDTLKRTLDQKTIHETPDRTEIWQVETPQVFRRELILQAYREVVESGVGITDDASALERQGGEVSLVPSSGINLKITRQSDWEMLQVWLARERGTRLRSMLHQVNNQMTPLIGFLPFLKKYREDAEKFATCHLQVEQGARQSVDLLRKIQELARVLFPEQK